MSTQIQKQNIELTKMNASSEINLPKFFGLKQIAFDAAGVLDNPVYLSRDKKPDEGCKIWGYVESHNDLAIALENDTHTYEVVKADVARQSYFDFDGKYQQVRGLLLKVFGGDNDDDMKPSSDIDSFFEDCVSNLISDFRLEHRHELGEINQDPQLVWTDASRGPKFSKHVVDKSIHFNNQKDCEVYHKKLREYMNDEDQFSAVSICFDKSVYDKDRSMRCVNQSKMTCKTDPRPLRITSQHQIKDTLITCISQNSTLFNVPEKWIKKHKETPVVIRSKEEMESDEPEVDLLLANISGSRFEEYAEWCNMVWCLYAVGLIPEQIHQESNERCPSKYEWTGCEGLIQQYNHANSKYSIETLRAWAKNDTGFESFRHKSLETVANSLPKNREDHLQFIEFTRQYHGQHVKGVGSSEGAVPIEQLERDLAKVVQHNITDKSFTVYAHDEKHFHQMKNSHTVHLSIIGYMQVKKSKCR